MAQSTDKGLQLRCNVSRSGNTITWTIEVWSASYAWDDAQTLHWSGATNGSANYHASAAYGETRKMYSRTVKVTGTPGNKYTLWTSISGTFNGANPAPGGVSATIPVSAPSTPSAPTVERVSDTSHTVSWSRTASSAAPVTSQQVQRSEWNGTAWTSWSGVANVNTSYTSNGNHSWTDPGTKANRRYRYRIKASNSSGEKYSSAYSNVYTTPGVPSSVSAVKTATNGINITVAQTVTFSQHQTVLRYSTNGGTSWSALTTLNSGVNTYLWTSPPSVPSVLIDAAVRVNASGAVGHSLLSGTRRSNSVGLTVPPNAPGGLTPNGITVAAGEGSPTVSWTYNSADSSAQSAFEVEVSLNPGSQSWSTVATGTTATSVALPAHVTESPIPSPLYWRVRTKGAHPDWSPYSASASFIVSARPVATVTSPSPVHESSRVTIGWSYSDEERTTQSMWEAELHLDGQNIESKSGSGSATSILMNTSLVDATEYQALVRVRDGHGLWSPWDQATFTTNFPVPPEPSINLEWDRELGQMSVSVLNPTGSPLVSYNVIQRSLDERDTWQDVMEVAYNGVGFDKTVPLGTRVWYRALAWTEVPSVSYSEEILYEDGYGKFGEPIINLFTNPNLVGSGSYATVAENLFTNPRLKGEGTWVEVRRNLVVNPSFENNVTGWAHGGVSVLSRGEGDAPQGDRYLIARSTHATLRRIEVNGAGSEFTPEVGSTWRLGAWVRGVGDTIGSGVTLRVASTVGHTSSVGVLTDEWQWLEHEFTIGSEGTYRPDIVAMGTPLDSEFHLDGVLLERAGRSGPYYDGNSPDFSVDPDMRTRWTGLAGNSETVLEGQTVSGVSGGSIRSVTILSTWEGKPAIRIVSTDPDDSSHTFATISATSGTEYTFIATIHNKESVTSGGTIARELFSQSPWVRSEQFLDAGSKPLRIVSTGTISERRLYGAPASERADTWYTDIGLFAGNYLYEAFNVDSAPADTGFHQPEDFRIRWTGEVDNSSSVMEIERVAGVSSFRSIAGVSTDEGRPAIRLIVTEEGGSAYFSFSIPEGPVRSGGTLIGTRNRSESFGSYALRSDSPVQFTPYDTSPGIVSERLYFGERTGTYRVYLYAGTSDVGGVDTWWTDIGLFAGEYDGPAFGGDTTGSDLVTYGWDGEPNNSTSFRLTRDTAPVEHTLGYWSAGTDLNQLVKMQVNLSNPPFIDLSSGLASKTLHYFSGRKSPVETTGEATARTGAVSFMVMTEEELHVAREMALLPAPHLFRMPDKTHVWASIGAVTDKRIDNGAYQITFEITEVDYNG